MSEWLLIDHTTNNVLGEYETRADADRELTALLALNAGGVVHDLEVVDCSAHPRSEAEGCAP